jgi:hypothetical protein
MTQQFAFTVLFSTLGVATAAAQGVPADTSEPELPTIRITRPVTANGQPLAPGTYQVRITDERPLGPTDVPSDVQRWVEFIANGAVAGREIAEMIPVEDARPVGTSSAPAAPRGVVQLLKEGDFVRVSIGDAGVRYLIYLPTGAPVQP